MNAEQRPKRQVVVKTKLILVEGVDEERFFEALLKHLGLTDVQVMPVGGKTGFRAMLAAIRTDERVEDVRSILLVRDADWDNPAGTNARTAWDALVGALLSRSCRRDLRRRGQVDVGILQGEATLSTVSVAGGWVVRTDLRSRRPRRRSVRRSRERPACPRSLRHAREGFRRRREASRACLKASRVAVKASGTAVKLRAWP